MEEAWKLCATLYSPPSTLSQAFRDSSIGGTPGSELGGWGFESLSLDWLAKGMGCLDSGRR